MNPLTHKESYHKCFHIGLVFKFCIYLSQFLKIWTSLPSFGLSLDISLLHEEPSSSCFLKPFWIITPFHIKGNCDSQYHFIVGHLDKHRKYIVTFYCWIHLYANYLCSVFIIQPGLQARG